MSIFPIGERVEHERVVGVGAVGNVDGIVIGIRGERIGFDGRERAAASAAVDVVPVQRGIPGAAAPLGRLRGEEPRVESARACGASPAELRDARGEDEPEQVRGVAGRRMVSAWARASVGVAADLGHAAEVVAQVGVQGPEHLVDGACHGSEELHAVGVPPRSSVIIRS